MYDALRMESKSLEREIAEILVAATDASQRPSLANLGEEMPSLTQRLDAVQSFLLRHIEALETVVIRLAREIDALRNA
jgi:hypothetical protein